MPRKRARNPLKRKKLPSEIGPKEDFSDDTPKAFQRLMKRAAGDQRYEVDFDGLETRESTVSKDDLKIRPGEKIQEFNRRVDSAIPLGRIKTGVPSAQHAKQAKRKQKIAERLKKEAEARKEARSKRRFGRRHEDDGDDDDDDDENDEELQADKKRLSKRDTSPDPWARLKADKPKFGEVVDRPPELNLPTKRLNNVPKSAGSMAKRLRLEQERDDIIARYRASRSSASQLD